MARSYTKGDSPIEAHVGETFELVVDAIPTAGYQWTIEVQGGAIRLIDRTLDTPPHKLGGSVREHFIVQATQPGPATIKLALTRPWEATAAERHSFDVTVSE
jgi:predicted secreted protein